MSLRLLQLFQSVWTAITSRIGRDRLFYFNFYLQVVKQLSDDAEWAQRAAH